MVGSSGEWWEREPTFQEIRSMTWQSVVNGSTSAKAENMDLSEEDEVPQKKFTPKFPEAQPKSVGRTSKPTNEEGGEEDDALDYFRKLAQE